LLAIRFCAAYAEFTMTDRLYYRDSFLYNFDAEVQSVIETPRPALILDRTAFYPTSGGQIHDTGWIAPVESGAGSARSKPNSGAKFRVSEVADTEDGHVVHYLEAPLKDLKPGTHIRGEIDSTRRRDHMQQHSAQHVLSAAFIQLFSMPTVSFHMAQDYSSIDLDTPSLSSEQIESAEHLANEIIIENRDVGVRFVTRDEAASLGLRKLPPADREQLRLIDIHGFDLSACGGTHVNQTGQIGIILLRKSEKVRQGYRLEFVAGQRAVAVARRDFSALSETAALYSAGIYDVPEQTRKSLEEIRLLRKQREQSQDELASAQATALFAETPEINGRKIVVRSFSDRDLSFLKLLAQKITRQPLAVVALLASESPQPAIVFAQTAGQPHDMGALLKETLARFGGRGGGSKDMAQGGVTNSKDIAPALAAVAEKLSH
jgi:alanyl-tRNA synthetase